MCIFSGFFPLLASFPKQSHLHGRFRRRAFGTIQHQCKGTPPEKPAGEQLKTSQGGRTSQASNLPLQQPSKTLKGLDDGWIQINIKNHVFFGKISTTSGIASFFQEMVFFLGGEPIQ